MQNFAQFSTSSCNEMIHIVLLLSMTPVAAVQLDIEAVIVRSINRIKLDTFYDKYQLMIFCGKNVDDVAQESCRQILMKATEPMMITSSVDFYQKNAAFRMHTVAFVEDLKDLHVMWYDTANRKILVIRMTYFRKVLKKLISKMCFNVIYIVYVETNCEMFHFNQFSNQLNKYDGFGDPIFESTKNLAGSSVAHVYGQELDDHFFKMTSRLLNSTFNYEGLLFIYEDEDELEGVTRSTNLVYMHQDTNFRLLVPRLNRPVPWVYVLTDPFDIYTWVMFIIAIFAVALLRSIISHKMTVQILMHNVASIFGTLILGSQIQFRSELEKQIVGLFLLLSVVLINAYQSLVISFLLSPRMYPELNTMELINDSCYWCEDEELPNFYFKHVRENCDYINPDYLSISLSNVQNLHALSYCTVLKSWMANLMTKENSLYTSSELFRLSAVTICDKPLIVVAVGDQEVVRRVGSIANNYFAGALYRTMLVAEKKFQPGFENNPTKVDELILVWTIFGVGLITSATIFFFECMIKFIQEKKRIKVHSRKRN